MLDEKLNNSDCPSNVRLDEGLHLLCQYWLQFDSSRSRSIVCARGSAFDHALHDADDGAFCGLPASVGELVDNVSQNTVIYCSAHKLAESGCLIAVV